MQSQERRAASIRAARRTRWSRSRAWPGWSSGSRIWRAEGFLHDFGFVVADRTPEALWQRRRWAASPCLLVRRTARSVGVEPVRANLPQRPPRRAAEIERIGHVVLGTSRFRPALADDSQRAAIPNLLRTYTIAWDLT